MQCQSQRTFIRKRKFLISEASVITRQPSKIDTIVFDTLGNVIPTEVPLGYLSPVDEKTVLVSANQGKLLSTFDLETGEEKRARYAHFEDFIVIGDWVYLIAQLELWKIRKDLTGRGQKSPEETRFYPSGGFFVGATTEIGGNIAEVKGDGVIRIFNTETLRFSDTYSLGFAGERVEVIEMKKLNDHLLVVKLNRRFFILNTKTRQSQELKGVPKTSSHVSLRYVIPNFDTFQGKRGMIFIVSTTEGREVGYILSILSSKNDYATATPLLTGDSRDRLHLVKALDEHHLVVINIDGKARLLEFSLEPVVTKKVLCEWNLGVEVDRIVEIPLTKEEREQETLRLVRELESVTPSASAILRVIVGFL